MGDGCCLQPYSRAMIYPGDFAERIYNKVLAQFGPMGRGAHAHVHSEGIPNFSIGRGRQEV